MAGHGITRVEHHAGYRGIVAGIQAVFTGGGEKEGNHARIQRHDGSQSKFAFRVADPALTKCKRHMLFGSILCK